MTTDDQTFLPEKFLSDDALAEAEKQQQALREKVTIPLAPHREMHRNRAMSIITTSPDINQQAEAYATLGEYGEAFHLTQNPVYQKYLDALENPKACPHPAKHLYIKEYVWSRLAKREVQLIACNVCGHWRIGDSPNEVKARQNGLHGVTSGMSIEDALAYHKQNVR